MNFRKFYFLLNIIISAFLILCGTVILTYLGTAEASAIDIDPDKKGGIKDVFTDVLDDFKTRKSPFNVLVLGGDKVNNNTDTIMLVNFDPAKSKVSVMSIPRDTRVTIDGKYRKINYAYPHGGAKLAVETVSDLLGVNIKYYVFVDTKAFRNIIDILGGVDYYIPVDMHYDDPTQDLHIHLEKGQHHLDGAKAEQFMRFRQPNVYTKEIRQYYSGSDLDRIKAQQSFLKELVRQKLNIKYITKMRDIIDEIFDNLETNITMSETLKLSSEAIKIKIENINMTTLPGYPYEKSPWYYIYNPDEGRTIIEENFRGE